MGVGSKPTIEKNGCECDMKMMKIMGVGEKWA
jgi:hypothetical protein